MKKNNTFYEAITDQERIMFFNLISSLFVLSLGICYALFFSSMQNFLPFLLFIGAIGMFYLFYLKNILKKEKDEKKRTVYSLWINRYMYSFIFLLFIKITIVVL